METPGTEPQTQRSRRKADRREAILAAAAALFAEHGYARTTLDEVGAAAGVSGPAVYRHFPGKAALLAAILLDASRALLDGAEAVLEGEREPAAALRALIHAHVAFAVDGPDVIAVQERELAHLDEDDRHAVRTLQRRYVEHWVDVLQQLRPDLGTGELRVRAHAAFGLMNSTPRSARTPGRRPAASAVAVILESMTLAALEA